MPNNTTVLEIPWVVAITLFKPHLLMAWMSQGKSLDEAKALFEKLKVVEPDEELYGLVEQLVEKTTNELVR